MIGNWWLHMRHANKRIVKNRHTAASEREIWELREKAHGTEVECKQTMSFYFCRMY